MKKTILYISLAFAAFLYGQTQINWNTQLRNRPNITRVGANATWTDNVTMTGTNTLSGPNVFTGTDTGVQTISGNKTFSGTNAFSGPLVNTGTDSGNQTISGNKTFSGANAFSGTNNFTGGLLANTTQQNSKFAAEFTNAGTWSYAQVRIGQPNVLTGTMISSASADNSTYSQGSVPDTSCASGWRATSTSAVDFHLGSGAVQIMEWHADSGLTAGNCLAAPPTLRWYFNGASASNAYISLRPAAPNLFGGATDNLNLVSYNPATSDVFYGNGNVGNITLQNGSGKVLTLGNTGANSDTVLNGGLSQNNGNGYQAIRSTAGCATGNTVGATCNTTVTWSNAFLDANYTVHCDGLEITSGVPVNGGITNRLAASVVFHTVATTAAAAQFTNIVCSAFHD